jgi:hypothetical protein
LRRVRRSNDISAFAQHRLCSRGTLTDAGKSMVSRRP